MFLLINSRHDGVVGSRPLEGVCPSPFRTGLCLLTTHLGGSYRKQGQGLL
jgi:hypothetical protein